MKPILAITMGDAAGIGPEIIAKALSLEEVYRICRPLVIGDERAIVMGMEVAKLDLRINRVSTPKEGLYRHGDIDLLSLDNVDTSTLIMGRPQAMAGKASVEFVVKAAVRVEESHVSDFVESFR